MKIGFFDSGLGGLTILKAVATQLPLYDYEYYGDTAHVPYGNKTETEIYALTKAGVEHLFERGCLLVVIACNTASAETLRQLQDTFLVDEYPERKILGVIIPMVEEVVQSHAKNALLIGTTRTVESGKYEREFAKLPDAPKLTSVATPQLVPQIEAGNIESALKEIYPLVDEFVAEGGDSLILGCTHYTLLREQLHARYKEKLTIFSQDAIIPKKLLEYLTVHTEIEQRLTRGATRNLFFTKHEAKYDHLIEHILGGLFIET
jgi:glutamate racemase